MTLRSLALSALLATGCLLRAEPVAPVPPGTQEAPPAPAAQALQGRLADGRYTAPGATYSVAVPVLHGDHAAIFDNGEIVVFRDKVATMLTIAAFPMPAIAKFEYETTGAREYLVAFFRDNILRDYRQEFPDSAFESARFLPDVLGGAMVAFTLLPGGSAFDSTGPAAPVAAPPVAKRGHLVFVRNNHIFVLAVELAERVTERDTYKLTTAEEDRLLFDRLVTVLATLRFGDKTEP